jgi:hypothetical protein
MRGRPDGRVRRLAGIVSAVLALALGLAACDLVQQTSPATPAAPSTSSAAPAPTRSAGASVRPSEAPSVAAIAAFVDLVGKSNFAYQVTFKGRSRHSTDRLPVKGTIAVSGKNYRVTASFTFRDGTGTVDHRYVGGKAWLRLGNEKWRQLNGFKPSLSMSPFASVDAVGAVKYLGTETGGDRTLYRVEIKSVPVHPLLIPAVNLTKEAVSSGILQLLIDDAGKPVTGTVVIRGTGRVSGQLQEIIIELTLTFTKVGQKVTVSAP